MEILSYLSELIQTRKSVGISGLGTVYKKKSPGRYDAATHSFIPPSYTLNFSNEIREEGLLADFISKKAAISIDTANHLINQFSTGILQQLNDHQVANLGDLGKLLKIDEELKFEPAEELNYGFDFYGLPVVKAPQESLAEEIIPETPDVEEPEPADQVQQEQEPAPEPEPAANFYRSDPPLSHNQVPEQQEENNGNEVYYPEEEEAKTTPLYLKIILGLLILIIVMAAAFFVKPEWFNGLTGNPPVAEQSAIQPVTKPAVSDTLASAAAGRDTLNNPTDTTTALKDKGKILPAVPKDSIISYEIIGASMHDQKEADKFIALMKRSGINAKVVTNMAGRRLKMSIATLKDEKSAQLERERLAKKLKIPGIYIYRNKQK